MNDTNATFWTIESPCAYEINVAKARRFTDEEKQAYVEDFKEYGMVSLSDSVILPFLSWMDMPKRPPDGAFCGCNNSAWIISEEEKDQYIALNQQRKLEKEEQERTERIEFLSAQIAKMKAKGELPTRAEADLERKRYNDIYNEGADGYVPHFYCKEELQAALEELDNLQNT